MKYFAKVTKEGGSQLVEFPDCPGCQTFAGPDEDVKATAAEALEGWLEANLVGQDAPPRAKRHHGNGFWVDVPFRLAMKVIVRQARVEARLTQGDLGKLLGISQPAVAKIEDPDTNTGLDTFAKVFAALKVNPEVELPQR